jgi:hypothetical protein
MRFKFLLPALQTAAMLVLVWAPWTPGAHQIDLRLLDGRRVKQWTLIPGPVSLDWALGVNLPAAAIAIPVEFAARGTEGLPNFRVRFYGFWLAGILCWYMVGRFVDDLSQWRRNRKLPRARGSDLAFALIAVPSSVLLAGAFTFGGAGVPSLAVWGAVWVAVTFAALLFRLAQVVRYRRRRPSS